MTINHCAFRHLPIARILLFLCGSLMLLSAVSCKKNAVDLSLKLALPITGQMPADSGLLISALSIDRSSRIQYVAFYYDDSLLGKSNNAPYTFAAHELIVRPGAHKLKAVAYGSSDAVLAADSATVKATDIREPYFGKFYFRVHYFKSPPTAYPPIDTMMYYEGTITPYVATDDTAYFLRFGQGVAGYSGHKITIRFLEDVNIIAVLQADGSINREELRGTHSHQSGSFYGTDSLSFSCSSGGMGGSFEYEVNGVRR